MTNTFLNEVKGQAEFKNHQPISGSRLTSFSALSLDISGRKSHR